MLLSMPVFSPAISPCLPSSSLPTGTFPVHATATLASLNSSTHLPQRLNASTASRSNDSTLTSTPPHHFFFQRLNVSSSSWSSSQHSGQLPDRQCTRAHAPLTTSLLTTCFSPLHYSLLTTHYLLLTILSTHYSLLLLTSYYSTLHPLTALLLTNHYSLFTHSLLCYPPTTTHSSPTHCSATHQPLLTLHPLTAHHPLTSTSPYSIMPCHAPSAIKRQLRRCFITKPLWLPPPPQLRPRHSPDAPHQSHFYSVDEKGTVSIATAAPSASIATAAPSVSIATAAPPSRLLLQPPPSRLLLQPPPSRLLLQPPPH